MCLLNVHVGGVKSKPTHRFRPDSRYVCLRIHISLSKSTHSVCSFSSGNVHNSFTWNILFYDLHSRHETMHYAGTVQRFSPRKMWLTVRQDALVQLHLLPKVYSFYKFLHYWSNIFFVLQYVSATCIYIYIYDCHTLVLNI